MNDNQTHETLRVKAAEYRTKAREAPDPAVEAVAREYDRLAQKLRANAASRGSPTRR